MRRGADFLQGAEGLHVFVGGALDAGEGVCVGSDLEVFGLGVFGYAALEDGEGEVVQVPGFELPLVWGQWGGCSRVDGELPVVGEEEVVAHDSNGPL